MAITVNFKTKRGMIVNRRFEKNEGISLYGKVSTLTGVGITPGTFIRLNVVDSYGNSIVHKETLTDFWGGYSFWFVTPDQNVKLLVKIFAAYTWAGQDETAVPIAVGNVTPLILPMPQAENAWLAFVPIVVVGVGLIYLVKVLK